MIKLHNFGSNDSKAALLLLEYALIVLTFFFVIGFMLWPVIGMM